MDFQLTEEQKMLKEMVHNFVLREIAPEVREWDEKEEFVTDKILKKYVQLGLIGLSLPEEYGGQGQTVFDVILVIEEIARVSPIAAMPIFESGVGPVMVLSLFGTEEQKQEYIPPVCAGDLMISVAMTEPDSGSALTDLKTTAALDGDFYLVNGQKRFVTGAGYSGAYMVYVRLSDDRGAEGIGGIIIEKGTPGFTFGKPESFMGLHGLPSSDLIFENCRVPKKNLVVKQGNFKNLMQAFDVERLGNAAMSLGIAEGALLESIRYSKERKQFGKEICEFQAIQLMLADMAMKVEAAKLLIYRAATETSQGVPSVLHSSLAKCFANEIAKEVTDLALQIHGGYGYSKEYPIERMLRDSRGWPIAGGTVQMQRVNIAAELVGRRFNQRS
jgi:alkylation response protein AidB-like acyl-CoA dehydrogenase